MTAYGVDALSTALTMIIGKNLALMVSPLFQPPIWQPVLPMLN